MPLSAFDIGIRLAVLIGIIGIPLIFLALRTAWLALRKASMEEATGPSTRLKLS